MISCVYNLWPNDCSQTLDIFLIHSNNRALSIVDCRMLNAWTTGIRRNLSHVQSMRKIPVATLSCLHEMLILNYWMHLWKPKSVTFINIITDFPHFKKWQSERSTHMTRLPISESKKQTCNEYNDSPELTPLLIKAWWFSCISFYWLFLFFLSCSRKLDIDSGQEIDFWKFSLPHVLLISVVCTCNLVTAWHAVRVSTHY